MKFGILSALLIVITLPLFFSCNKDKGFNPKDRTTIRMTEEQRSKAVNALKQQGTFNLDSMLNGNNVKMSVLPPSSEALTDTQKELFGVRMLQILTANGIGGINNVPGFAMTATIGQPTIKVTGSAPQKFLSEIEINYSVVNTVNGDVYATAIQRVQGVGSSAEEANNQALSNITTNQDISKMLRLASDRIVDWYNNNLAVLKAQISEAEANNDYALALALIQSVPQQATQAFAFAESNRTEIENKFKLQVAHNELTAMKEAIMDSDNEPSSQVYAHYLMIPTSSPYYSEATAALNKYEKDVEAKRTEVSERKQADLQEERQMQMELAKMENTRIIAKYTAQAAEQGLRLFLSQGSRGGFWSNLGARIIGAIDGTNWQYKVENKPYTED